MSEKSCGISLPLLKQRFFYGATAPSGVRASSLSRLHDHTSTHHTTGLLWTSDRPCAETCSWQHTTITHIHASGGGFEPAIPTSERPQTHVLDRVATGSGEVKKYWCQMTHFETRSFIFHDSPIRFIQVYIIGLFYKRKRTPYVEANICDVVYDRFC